MDYELIRAYCATDLRGILKARDKWYSTPESRFEELECQIPFRHRTGARYLEPRQYAAAVCLRALELRDVPFQADGDYPEFTQADSDEVAREILAKALSDYLPHLSPSEAAPLMRANAVAQQTAPASDTETPAPVAGSASTETEPAPKRRLARLRALGGDAIYRRGDWKITGISALVESEKSEGRKRSDEKTIRADLKEAAEDERDAKRANAFAGLGQR